MLKHTGRGFALVALLVAGSVWALRDYDDPERGIQRGIDLLGGTELVYRIDLDQVRPESRSTIVDDVKAVIANRFDAFGLKEINIATAGRDRLIVQLPGFDNATLQRMKQQIEQSGELSFHLRSIPNYQTEAALDEIEAAWREYEAQLIAHNQGERAEPPVQPDRRVVRPRPAAPGEAPVDPAARVAVEWGAGTSVGAKYLQSAASGFDQYGGPAINFTFGGAGATQFGELTGNNLDQMLCIVLDGTMVSQARIESRIDGRGQIHGSFTQEEVDDIVTLLRAGSLPAKPELANEQTIGALLGRESVDSGVQSMLIGFVVVVVFMLLFYGVGGIVANIALFLNLLFLLAAVQVFRNTLTLPGMAGLLLTVGMAVDANILIFARIREERARGRGLAQAVQAGYQRVFWTIFDSNVTTLITAYVLFKFGSGAVKGFAVILSIGIITSFFTSIYVTRLLLTVLIRAGWVKELRMPSLLTDTKIDFMSKWRIFATASAVFIAVGLIVLAVRGKESLGLDFTGGARLIANLSVPTSEADVRERIAALVDEKGERPFQDVQVQTLGERQEAGGERVGTSFSIRTRHIDDQPAAESAGAVRTESSTDRFRRMVEENLTAAGMLAPPGIVDVRKSESPPEFRATLNLFDEEGTLTSSEVQSRLAEAGFPVTEVLDRTAAPGNPKLISFQVVAVPSGTTSVHALEGELSRLLQERLVRELSLSSPFAEVNSIGASVAQDMQGKVFVSLMISFLAIVFYMSLRFRFQFGLAAILAIVHDVLVSVGALVIADAFIGDTVSLKINLPVIAALLTTIGYSLNDTIVIFDRVRENLEGKKRDVNFSDVVNLSVNQTLSRTILTATTVLIVTLVLLFLGGEGLTAFSFALTIGVIAGTYSTLYIASPAIVYFHKRSIARREQMLAVAAGK